ncbi:MAG TPA: hypothetical protein VLF93_03750 [Candidatus Saccharimonadales bacterium]|nr:hypothetical protein [Candidatus Saccharimonadales bacterium]
MAPQSERGLVTKLEEAYNAGQGERQGLRARAVLSVIKATPRARAEQQVFIALAYPPMEELDMQSHNYRIDAAYIGSDEKPYATGTTRDDLLRFSQIRNVPGKEEVLHTLVYRTIKNTDVESIWHRQGRLVTDTIRVDSALRRSQGSDESDRNRLALLKQKVILSYLRASLLVSTAYGVPRAFSLEERGSDIALTMREAHDTNTLGRLRDGEAPRPRLQRTGGYTTLLDGDNLKTKKHMYDVGLRTPQYEIAAQIYTLLGLA